MLLIGNDMDAIKEVKKQLSSNLDMKDIGATKLILEMDIKRDQAARKLWLNQTKYIETVLKQFNMQYCKPMKVPIPVGARLIAKQCPKTQEEIEDMVHVPYASAVGGLMYAMVCTRPKISDVVGVLSRYMLTLGKEHKTIVKRVFRYLCGTKDYVICYQGRPRGDNGKLDIHGFVDANWVGDMDRWRLTNVYVFKMFGGAIRQMSK
jgi:hypothetical protein